MRILRRRDTRKIHYAICEVRSEGKGWALLVETTVWLSFYMFIRQQDGS